MIRQLSLTESLSLTSSTTSRTAASFGSSPGSTPPDGTTHRPGCRELEISRTYNEQTSALQCLAWRPVETCVLPCGRTKCVEPLFPDQFWSRHILLSSCIHPHLSFWYYFRGFLSFSWVQDNSKEVLLTAENEHADLSPWQDYMHTKRRLVIYIVTPVYCGIFDETGTIFWTTSGSLFGTGPDWTPVKDQGN